MRISIGRHDIETQHQRFPVSSSAGVLWGTFAGKLAHRISLHDDFPVFCGEHPLNLVHQASERSPSLLLGMDVSSGIKAAGTDGNSVIVLNLARSIAELAERGELRLELYAPPDTRSSWLPARLLSAIPGLPMCTAEHRQVRYGLAAKLMVRPPDVFLNVASGYQPRLHRARQISIVYDLAFDIDEWKSYYTPELAAFLHDNTATAVPKAYALIAISQQTSNDLQRIYGVSPQRIRVIYPGYDRQRFRPEKETIDEELRTKLGSEPYFVTVGTIQPRKNYDRLIRAFVRFRRESGLSYRLIIVGGAGWLSEPTVELAREHVANGVVLWGREEQAQIAPILRGATAFVFPALYEGFGIPVIEAMACGTPVVASNTGPVPEIAGGAALLFDPRSEEEMAAMFRLIAAEPDTRRQLAQQSLRRAQDFSWEKAAREYVEFAREVKHGLAGQR